MKNGISNKKMVAMVLVSGLWGLVPAFGAIILIGPTTNNGSFESPVMGDVADQQTVPGSWTKTQPGTWPPYYVGLSQYHNGERPHASEGTQFLLMNNNGIYQTISATAMAGSIYSLAADYGNGDSGRTGNPDTYTFTLDAVNPSNPGDVVNLITGIVYNIDDSTWRTYSGTSAPVDIAQNGWNLRLTLSVPAIWSTIDNVNLTVPEPAGLLLLGLGALPVLARRRRHTAGTA